MLAAILQSAGYKTGLYTSPHLVDFRERIRINGEMIPESFITEFVEKHRAVFDRIEPSFFEWTVGLAFEYFAHEKVEIAVIETGLGGRLDSTNVITPLLSIITNISPDHMNLLGNTLPAIAGEKAGIIKNGIPVVIGERQSEVEHVFLKKAKEENAPLVFASDLLNVQSGNGSPDERLFKVNGAFELPSQIHCDLTGLYQENNIATVLCSVLQLRKLKFNLNNDAIKNALQNVKSLTGLSGRWQTLQMNPLTICDVGHNKAGIEFVLRQIKETPHKILRIVFGVVNDKDVSTILKMLPSEATYYFCKANLPRALDENTLLSNALEAGLSGRAYPSVQSAITAALHESAEDDLVFIGGSTFVVGEVLPLFAKA